MILETKKDLGAVVESIGGSRRPESTSDPMLLLSIDALESVCNIVRANFDAGASVLLRGAVWKDNVEPALADLGVAAELFDESWVLLSGVVDYLDQFGYTKVSTLQK